MKNLLTTLLIIVLTSTFGLAQVTHSGSWIEKSYEVEGKWEIVKKGEQYVLKFDNDFDTKKAPDLKIFLSKLPSNQVTAKNAAKGTALVSELKEYEGKQEFVIPKSLSISDYKTLLIHCEQYGVLWSIADLN
ncbi:MAG: DM13 domain-containing protein [Bacteroidota bacterium]